MDNYTLSERMKAGRVGPLLAAFWATLVAAYLYWAATYDRSVVYLRSDTSQFESMKNQVIAYAKIVAVTGPSSAFGLTVPIFLALLPLATRKHRRAALVVAGVLTLGVCLVWPFSIGLLYLPSAVLLLFAAGRISADPAPAI
jgi:hypothetical protein